MNRPAFYAALRKSGLFGAGLSPSQVQGIEGILDAFATHGDGRARTLAYALATAYHEVGGRMVPVREGFASTDAAARAAVAHRAYGKPAGPYGHVYYGRGLVQLTWLDNYIASSRDAGTDLERHPDAMLEPVTSARILVKGLLDGRWNRLGKGIATYLPTGGPDDLRGARRTVNITDRWELIGGYYQKFLDAIDAAGGVPRGTPAPPPSPPRGAPALAPSPAQPPDSVWPFGLVVAAVAGLVLARWAGLF